MLLEKLGFGQPCLRCPSAATAVSAPSRQGACGTHADDRMASAREWSYSLWTSFQGGQRRWATCKRRKRCRSSPRHQQSPKPEHTQHLHTGRRCWCQGYNLQAGVPSTHCLSHIASAKLPSQLSSLSWLTLSSVAPQALRVMAAQMSLCNDASQIA